MPLPRSGWLVFIGGGAAVGRTILIERLSADAIAPVADEIFEVKEGV